MSEFEFRPVEVHEIVEEDGVTYRNAVTPPVCDFCSDKRVRWEYDCEDFTIADWGSSGQFAACDACSALIEAADWDALKTRVMRSWRVKSGQPLDNQQRYDACRIVNGFVHHYSVGRRGFG